MSRTTARRESGSVAVLTLLAFALISGVFLYVAVIGSRASETARVRVAADATAMAAATVKAKVMNYESFVLLADTVLLPLGQITDNILTAQAAAEVGCIAISLLFPEVLEYCFFEYGEHVAKTAEHQEAVNNTVTEWLDGLEATAEMLQKVGPQWAEFAAVRAGGADSYSGPGNRGVTAAAAFPVPDLTGECSKLGIEMVDNNEATKDGDQTRDACHDLAFPLEQTYLLASLDPLAAAVDEGGLIITGNSLVFKLGPANCTKTNKAPNFADNWKKYSVSRGLALSESPKDQYHLRLLEKLRGTTPPKTLLTGYLLGMGCAEHYARDHYGGDESLWHMDWRARLIPCEFEKEENAAQILDCGAQRFPGSLYARPDHVLKMQAQFELQRALGVAKYWRY